MIQEYYDLQIFNHRIIGPNLQKFKMADKKTNGRLSLRLLKRAQEKQSESLSQLCTITISPFTLKPHKHSFRVVARGKWVTF